MEDWHKFKPPELKKKGLLKNKKYIYQYEPMFFDSETSKKTFVDASGVEMVDDCWVYIWACSVGDRLYYGRYLHEFFEFLHVIQKAYNINKDNPIDIYIHNLSYDISYMYDLLFHYSDDIEISSLWTAFRHVISFNLGNGICFKCSYRLSGRALEKWAKDLSCGYQKQVGMIDYKLCLYPWDKLPHEQYKYLAYDVLTQKECFYKEIDLQGYTFANVPLTMTGFVRKDFQRAFMQKGKYFTNSLKFAETRLTISQYQRLLKASAGGMTAVSIRYISRKVEHPEGIGHVDFESHYPTQQICKRFPMKPRTIKEENDRKTLSLIDLDWYEKKFNMYYVVEIELKDIIIKKGITAPFLFSSKCVQDANAQVVACNGKIVQVFGIVKVCLTNFDLSIIREQYDITGYNILSCDVYTTAHLPAYITDTIKRYYKAKTDLKRALSASHDEDLKLNYNLSKSKLNSVFGCTFTKPVRPEISIDEHFNFKIDYNANTLDDYYSKKTSCLSYAWGVFTTSLARYELYNVIHNIVGYNNFLYCDTDSVFYLATDEIEKNIDDYNATCLSDSMKNDYSVTLDDGTKKYFHRLDREDDHRKSKTFKALHAKCYALETPEGLEITVAGVPKRGHGTTREDELQTIDNLCDGFVFTACGGTRADYTTIREYKDFTGGGCAILDTKKEIHEVLFREGDYLDGLC